jgi:hypothetical protein
MCKLFRIAPGNGKGDGRMGTVAKAMGRANIKANIRARPTAMGRARPTVMGRAKATANR